MSAPQMTHWLKVVGKGSMEAGIRTVFGSGVAVGVGGALIVGAAVYGTYRVGRWAYRKCQQYLIDEGYVDASVCIE